MSKFIVTTVRKPTPDVEKLAEEISLELGGKFVAREDFSFDKLKKLHGAENILLVKKDSLSVVTGDGELFFHPNTAHLRIKNLREGDGDRLIDALKISDGSTVLDFMHTLILREQNALCILTETEPLSQMDFTG